MLKSASVFLVAYLAVASAFWGGSIPSQKEVNDLHQTVAYFWGQLSQVLTLKQIDEISPFIDFVTTPDVKFLFPLQSPNVRNRAEMTALLTAIALNNGTEMHFQSVPYFCRQRTQQGVRNKFWAIHHDHAITSSGSGVSVVSYYNVKFLELTACNSFPYGYCLSKIAFLGGLVIPENGEAAVGPVQPWTYFDYNNCQTNITGF